MLKSRISSGLGQNRITYISKKSYYLYTNIYFYRKELRTFTAVVFFANMRNCVVSKLRVGRYVRYVYYQPTVLRYVWYVQMTKLVIWIGNKDSETRESSGKYPETRKFCKYTPKYEQAQCIVWVHILSLLRTSVLLEGLTKFRFYKKNRIDETLCSGYKKPSVSFFHIYSIVTMTACGVAIGRH